MCICNYTLSEIDNEEMSIHEVFQATVDDFNRIISLSEGNDPWVIQ